MQGNGKTVWSDARLSAEVARCVSCEEKPCREACPAHCSPADFIRAVRVGQEWDFRRATALILGSNPLGGICGAVCPDTHCVKACSRRTFDQPVEIPTLQAEIVRRGREAGGPSPFRKPVSTGRHVAVVGAGPAGLGATAVLAQLGHAVTVFDRADRAGGACRLIPSHRLDPEVLAADVAFVAESGYVNFRLGEDVPSPDHLLEKGFDAVVASCGRPEPLSLGIPGEEFSEGWESFLARLGADPAGRETGARVLVVGGGAVAVDVAVTAARAGAASVEMLCLETWAEMPLTAAERRELLETGISVTGRVRVIEVLPECGAVTGVWLRRVSLPPDVSFHPSRVADDARTDPFRLAADRVILAIGSRPGPALPKRDGLFIAGDALLGPATVVEAVASGKNAAEAVHAYLLGLTPPVPEKPGKNRTVLAGRDLLPVPLECDFFGRPIRSPFLLSAAPPSDGYDQVKKAYEAGWSGAVLKTAFDGLSIHIPAAYMFRFGSSTYGNCDNVSAHPLDRVCGEVERLVREFPDRLTLASTGGPVTGCDEEDRAVWASNTRKLESSGVMGIEYSLSCPQGGDGTKGDIVSQDPELTAKIVGWVLEAGNPDVPKLFKLTAAVTAIYPIIDAIRQVFARYPRARAGVTLANTFPSLAFRDLGRMGWEEGVVVGLSGEGVTPISNLTLANVSGMGVVVSGNGGPMDYRAAADFLALGARTVQFCSVVLRDGVEVIEDLHSGLSHLMESRGIRSVSELIGRALPNPIRGFMELPSEKGISAVDKDLCQHCGNCRRCPYLAIAPDADGFPVTDPASCVGCSLCTRQCFSGALSLRVRTAEERSALAE